MKKLPEIILMSVTALALSACSGAKEQMGLTRKAPDEFAVVKRAPLAMPPDYSLRPPAPGADRPQETDVEEKAREVVFGGKAQGQEVVKRSGSAEDILLQQTGGIAADPSIRGVVDSETDEDAADEKPVAEKLLGWTKGSKDEPEAKIVDAPAEAERLRKNEEEGKSVTDGATPTKIQ